MDIILESHCDDGGGDRGIGHDNLDMQFPLRKGDRNDCDGFAPSPRRSGIMNPAVDESRLVIFVVGCLSKVGQREIPLEQRMW